MTNNTNNIDIFENVIPQSGEFFSFKTIGDAIQGTYIDKRKGVDSFNNEQTIYMIKDKDNKIWNVAFRDTSFVVHERMATIKFGQIVGFRFDEERDSKKMPGKKAKIIKIYADNKFIDKEWLARQKELETLTKNDDNTKIEASQKVSEESEINSTIDTVIDSAIDDAIDIPTDTVPATGSLPQEEKGEKKEATKDDALKAIIELAKKKELITSEMTADEQVKAIEKYTELSITEENFTKIIIKLTDYKK